MHNTNIISIFTEYACGREVMLEHFFVHKEYLSLETQVSFNCHIPYTFNGPVAVSYTHLTLPTICSV